MSTILYNPIADSDILALGQLAYGQFPIAPISPTLPLSLQSNIFINIPDLKSFGTSDTSGFTLDTNGTAFVGVPGYDAFTFLLSGGNLPLPAPLSFSADANTGYSGFTNYTLDLDGLDFDNISLAELAQIEDSLAFELVDSDFPALDSSSGFTVAFDLAIAEEASNANRAGFSVIAVTDDTSKAIEIGFKTEGSDRAFAQSATFTEAENSSAISLDFSNSMTYWLSVSGDTYSLAANGVEVLTGNLRDYDFDPANSDPALPSSANPYETPNFLFWGDNTDQGYAEFTLGKIEVAPLKGALTPDLYDDYIASYADLIEALGYDLDAARQHYIDFGFEQERLTDRFDEATYLASNGDLIAQFGYDLDAATRHYIEFGFRETRLVNLFSARSYLNGQPDLKPTFGDDLEAATRHYIEFGFAEGRDPLAGVDFRAYIASYDDLITNIGNDPIAGRSHYLQFGLAEGRSITFEADDYVASHPDLITAFRCDLEAATAHFINFGAGEGRARDTFDEVAYLDAHADLKAVIGDDLTAATKHYIEFGFAEGR